MSWEEIAKGAYQAYAASTGNKNFRGEPMPEFENLSQSVQIAWEVAVRHTINCYWSTANLIPDPSIWAGWVPPRFQENQS